MTVNFQEMELYQMLLFRLLCVLSLSLFVPAQPGQAGSVRADNPAKPVKPFQENSNAQPPFPSFPFLFFSLVRYRGKLKEILSVTSR